jgi:hypothetical protein
MSKIDELQRRVLHLESVVAALQQAQPATVFPAPIITELRKVRLAPEATLSVTRPRQTTKTVFGHGTSMADLLLSMPDIWIIREKP